MIYKRGCDKKGPNSTCSKCGNRGSCGVYWYKFMWKGELVRESTKQGNDKVARQMEAAHRTSLAKGEVGIRKKEPAPTLGKFCEDRITPWAEAATCRKTWVDYYRPGLRCIQSYKPVADLRLDQITSEHAADFAAWRLSQGLQVSSVNSSLQVLRRVLHLASEWGLLDRSPLIRLLPGERHREHVVTPEEEERYLAAAPQLLASVAVALVDTGMRPDECFRLRWEAVSWAGGRNGTVLVTHGKTAAARRVLPMTPRVRAMLWDRWEAGNRPLEGWMWPSATQSGHIEASSLKKQHRKTLRLSLNNS